jgi:hypothetical protein
MITRKERSKLIEVYKDEPLYAAGTVLKCAACLLIIGGLAVVGSAGEPTDRPVVQAQRSNDSSVVGTTPHDLQQVSVSSSQATSAREISPQPADAIHTRPVVFDSACPACVQIGSQ